MKPLAQVSVLQTNDDRHKNNTDEHLEMLSGAALDERASDIRDDPHDVDKEEVLEDDIVGRLLDEVGDAFTANKLQLKRKLGRK